MLKQAVFLRQELSFNLFNISLSEIEDLPPDTQEKLYSELLDRDAQHELEEDAAIINWSEEVRYSFNFPASFYCISYRAVTISSMKYPFSFHFLHLKKSKRHGKTSYNFSNYTAIKYFPNTGYFFFKKCCKINYQTLALNSQTFIFLKLSFSSSLKIEKIFLAENFKNHSNSGSK